MAHVVTSTPSVAARCPTVNPGLEPGFESAFEKDALLFPKFFEPALAFLNQGGSPRALQEFFNQHDRSIFEGDLTADGVPELGIFDTHLSLLGCVEGQYQVLLAPEAGFLSPPQIVAVIDMTLNTTPEMVIYHPDSCGFGGRCSDAAIYEWDGNEFRALTQDKNFGYFGSIGMRGPFTIDLRDIDQNGTIELLLEGGIGAGSIYADGLPWRTQTDTYMWNGEVFLLCRTEFAAPEYRFQAVQDADQAMVWGEYQKAFALYQRVTSDGTLEWWTPERHRREQSLIYFQFESPTPTPLPAPGPNPNETGTLTAYSRYRIILLHLLQGDADAATGEYNALLEQFPRGQPGHGMAKMATAFWDEYQATHNLGQACAEAVSYARLYPGILTYLGSDYHGWQSHTYIPEDVCTFN